MGRSRDEGSKGESEEGIYLLAKELAMNTVRDNTTRLGLGIGRLSKGEVKAFHAAFVAADKSLDTRVCKDGSNSTNCQAGTGTNNLGHAYKDGGAEKVGDTDAPNIAKSISQLNKEEKATLAAAFAKAVEGPYQDQGA